MPNEAPHLDASSDFFSKNFSFNEIILFGPQLLLSGPTAPGIPMKVFPASPDNHLILPFVLAPSLFLQNSWVS